MTEKELLIDCFRRLNGAGIAYMLTGSMASNYWGIPHTTHDLDFVVRVALDSIPGLVAAFEDEFFIDEHAVRGALDPPYQFNAIDNRSSLKVDFWVLHPDRFEPAMFDRRLETTLFGERAWIARAEDVVLHKLHWHGITPSERQIHDAAGIAVVQEGRLDLDYLRFWAKELGVAHLLEEILAGKHPPKHT